MSTAVAASPLTRSQTSTHDRDSTFFTVAAVANGLIIAAGFGYSAYVRLQLGDPRFSGALTTMVRLHAAVSAAWIALLIVQTRLIAASRIRLHRRLGILGGLIAVAVVIIGWFVALAAFRRDAAALGPMALRFFIMPVQELGVFTALIGAAVWLRKSGAHHKRLMLLGTLALIPAATTRLFLLSPESLPMILAMFGFPEAMFVVALGVHDRRTSGRLHPATLWGGGLLLVCAVSRTWVGGTAAWLAIAEAVIR